MRIHTNTLSYADLAEAMAKAGVWAEGLSRHGSRKRDHAWNVLLRGNSKRRPNGGSYGDDYAATWDQWGIFLAELYRRDPEMLCPYYKNANDFHRQTAARFADLTLADSHGDHSWIVGEPYRQTCRNCTAVRQWGPRVA